MGNVAIAGRTVKIRPRVAAGLVRRARGVEVPLYLEEGCNLVMVQVSKRALLRALRRAQGRGLSVKVAEPFGDGNVVVG